MVELGDEGLALAVGGCVGGGALEPFFEAISQYLTEFSISLQPVLRRTGTRCVVCKRRGIGCMGRPGGSQVVFVQYQDIGLKQYSQSRYTGSRHPEKEERANSSSSQSSAVISGFINPTIHQLTATRHSSPSPTVCVPK